MLKKLHNRWLIVPENRGSLQVLPDRNSDFSNSAMWLDGLEQKLDAEALRQLRAELDGPSCRMRAHCAGAEAAKKAVSLDGL
jgi:hypothetical protein